MENQHSALPPVFIINLPRHAERRQIMKTRLQEIGLTYEFIDGVDGKTLSPDDLISYDRQKRLRYFGRDLQPGEIGCLLSHRKIFQKMVDEQLSHAVILEDDVIFEAEFPAVLQALLTTPVPWDVIRFLGSEKIYARGCRKIAPLAGHYQLARLPTAPGGAHGYLMSQKAAQVMLRHMQRNWLPIDTLQGRTWETGLETLVVHPAPLYPDQTAGSTIGDARFDKTVRLSGLEKTLFPLARSWFKLTESCGKRYSYAASWRRDRRQHKKLTAQ